MSEIQKLFSDRIEDWLKKETSSTFVPVHQKAQKLLGEMRKALEDIEETSRMLLDNSGKEIEKRNMKTYGRARALNKLARLFINRMRQIKTPEKVSYESLNQFHEEVRKAFLVTEIDVRNWFSRISPFFILDRRKFLVVFEKSKVYLKEIHEFLEKEYVKTKTLEETFKLIDDVETLGKELANLAERKRTSSDERASIEEEITKAQQKIADMRSRDAVSQLDRVNSEAKQLRVELRRNLRHLRKPFIKLQSLSLHGGGSGLTPEEFTKFNQYVETPFQAFATESTGYPILKQILQKLHRSISEDKLKLKSDRKRKAEHAIESILDKNSLIKLHQKCVDSLTLKKRLLASAELAKAKREISELKKTLEDLERKHESVELEEDTIERAYTEEAEKARNFKETIEKSIYAFTGKKVQIV